MTIALIAFGSRGDVQPFLALALALRERGHKVLLAAPNDFKTQISSYGIDYVELPLSFQALLENDMSQQMMEKGINPITFINSLRDGLGELKRSRLLRRLQ